MTQTLIVSLPEMSIDQTILLAYGVGVVMGFVLGRLYPKRQSASDGRCPRLGFFIYILGFVIGYLLGLLTHLI